MYLLYTFNSIGLLSDIMVNHPYSHLMYRLYSLTTLRSIKKLISTYIYYVGTFLLPFYMLDDFLVRWGSVLGHFGLF